MAVNRKSKVWTLVIILLIAVITIGVTVMRSHFPQNELIEISLPSIPPVENITIGPNQSTAPQKININRADTWLLEALPGIGETLAQRIVDYRMQNGLFRSTGDLANVKGIGLDVYDKIKDLITVSD